MSAISQYFEWHYLPFIIPLLFSLIMILLSQLVGLANSLDGDINHDLHQDAHHDLTKTAGGPGETWNILSLFGIGKVPLSVLTLSMGLVWGVSGFIANLLFQRVLPVLSAFLVALAVALVSTLTLAYLISRIFLFLSPPEENGARKEVSLLGEIGIVQSSISTESGIVLVRSGNDSFRVSCRIQAGESIIKAGESVQLIAYEPSQNLFYAHAITAEEPPKPRIELLERR
ncbi:MAG: hypothetical protein AB1489_03800 [Acidobacteriota bacterium]